MEQSEASCEVAIPRDMRPLGVQASQILNWAQIISRYEEVTWSFAKFSRYADFSQILRGLCADVHTPRGYVS